MSHEDPTKKKSPTEQIAELEPLFLKELSLLGRENMSATEIGEVVSNLTDLLQIKLLIYQVFIL